jgi:tripartite-type tricarboxylate transporter receptor subunit TctC
MSRIIVTALALLAMLAGEAAAQQAWPSRPVRIVVPSPPAGGTDIVARVLADHFSRAFGQQFFVENRPGAGNMIGIESVARAAPDGYTFLMVASTLSLNSVLYKKVSYDPIKDFAPIMQVASAPNVLIVNPTVPAKSLTEFIALAKQKPGALNFASAGTTSTSYLAGEVFKQVAKIDIVHIPHKGAPEAATSILRNDSQLYFATASGITELIESKKVKALAISSAKRFPPLPNVPTVSESGLPDYVYDSWFGVMAPAGTPKPILAKASHDIAQVLQMPDVAQAMRNQGLIVVTQAPDQFDAMIKSEAERYGKILRDAGVGAN